jgi:hypothetical protein
MPLPDIRIDAHKGLDYGQFSAKLQSGISKGQPTSKSKLSS